MVTHNPQASAPVKEEPSCLKLSRKPGDFVLIGTEEDLRVERTATGWRVIKGEVSMDLDSGTPARGGICVMAPRSIPVRRGELPKNAA